MHGPLARGKVSTMLCTAHSLHLTVDKTVSNSSSNFIDPVFRWPVVIVLHQTSFHLEDLLISRVERKQKRN